MENTEAVENTGAVLNSNSDGSIIIAVMGMTGSGKSSFVRKISGDESVVVGANLLSETVDVRPVNFIDPVSNRTVTIVDTPGFDDTNISDTDILKKIAEFLLAEYDANRKLNGLVYFQRISDPRFSGQSKRNLRMFQRLCGADSYQNTVVLTTFWDRVSEDEGDEREREFHSNYFRELVEGKAEFMRYSPEYPDIAQDVIDHIVGLSKPVDVVQIAKEIREEGKNFEDTAAGSMQREEVDQLIAKHRKEVDGIRAEMNEMKVGNEARIRELEEDKEELQNTLEGWLKEREKIKSGINNAKKPWSNFFSRRK